MKPLTIILIALVVGLLIYCCSGKREHLVGIDSLGRPVTDFTNYGGCGRDPTFNGNGWDQGMNCSKPCVGGMGRPRCCNKKSCPTPVGSAFTNYSYNSLSYPISKACRQGLNCSQNLVG